MFKWIKNWWCSTAVEAEDIVERIYDEMVDDDANTKRFTVTMEVTNATKIRALKTTMTDAIVQRLAVTNPEVTDIDIKLDYKKHK